jgi:thioredoxin reductase (NADPH)
MSDPAFDVAVIGGGYAGLSAALPLARARRRVIVLDTGAPRNRFAAASHGVLGHDGRAPAEIARLGRDQLAAYPTATVRDAAATAATGAIDRFGVATASGPVAARRLILAFGMHDLLPDIPGLAPCWGVTALQCPYCHGYEAADRPTGVLMSGPEALHQVRLLTEWTADLALLANGHAVEPAAEAELGALGVRVLRPRVVGVEAAAGRLRAVAFEGGASLPLAALYLHARAEPASGIAAALGCRSEQGPSGPVLTVDAKQATSVPGVYAAGDLCRPVYSAPAAAADGFGAGVAAHQSLVFGA